VNIKKKILVFTCFVFSVFLYAERSPDSKMAELYARYAWSAYRDQNWYEFNKLTDKGAEFDSENPDLLSFQAMSYFKDRKFRSAGEKLDAAFYNSRKTEYFSTHEILKTLAEIHYRLGEYEVLINLYNSVSEMNREDPDFLFFTSMAYYNSDRENDAVALAEEGVYRFQDQRFLILLTAWVPDSGYPVILNEFLDKQGILYPELMAQLIIQTNAEEGCLSLQYRSRTKDYNSWYFASKLSNPPSESILFSPGLNDQRIWPERVVRKVWEESSSGEKITNPFSSEILKIDQSGDGIEDWTIRPDGNTYLWERDEDQDGKTDFNIRWTREQLPQHLEYYGPDGTIRCYYYDYPNVERIEITGNSKTMREYLYLPGSYELPLIEEKGISWLNALSLKNEDISIRLLSGESAHLNACYSLKDSIDQGDIKLFREYTVINGSIRRFREDSNFDGFFDRVVLLNEWQPYEGFRDLNLDGQFDLKEMYRAGRLIGMEIQGDHSRLEEYYDLWNRKQYQLWDFDQSSFYDAILIKNSDLTWNEYKLDSNFIMQSGSDE